jgi:hypothetical protein
MDVINEYTSLDARAQYIYAAKVLNRKCPLIERLPMVASNQIMSNIGTRESYLPAPGTRRFNEYISPTASHVTPFTDPIAMVEDYSKVDYNLWKIQNDPNKDSRKIEALTQKMESLILYGSLGTDPGAFNGLATRFNSLTYRPNGDTTWPINVIDGGGSGGDTTSIFVLQLGPGMVYGIYPKNLPGGLNIQDKGQVTDMKTDTTVKYMEVLMTHFQWFMGLVVEDERCVVRIANLEVSGTSNIFDDDDLITAINNLPDSGNSPGTVILAGRKTRTQMQIRAKDKNNVNYNFETAFGRVVTTFMGIPVLLAEKLLETETAVA